MPRTVFLLAPPKGKLKQDKVKLKQDKGKLKQGIVMSIFFLMFPP